MQELRNASSAHFITFTYDDDNLPTDNNLSKKHFQDFMKRLRKEQKKISDDKIRYYAVGEYGEKTNRPHYHAIIFNLKSSVLIKIDKIWKNGQTLTGSATQSSIHYVTKYMIKINQVPGRTKQFSLMSRRPYLGANYVNPQTKRYHLNVDPHSITHMDGHKLPIPKIYKEKFFGTLKRQLNAQEALKQAVEAELKLREKAKKRKLNYEKRMAENRRHKTEQMYKQSKSKKV